MISVNNVLELFERLTNIKANKYELIKEGITNINYLIHSCNGVFVMRIPRLLSTACRGLPSHCPHRVFPLCVRVLGVSLHVQIPLLCQSYWIRANPYELILPQLSLCRLYLQMHSLSEVLRFRSLIYEFWRNIIQSVTVIIFKQK